jgi:hypothetical protein
MSLDAVGIKYKNRKELHPKGKWKCPSCGVEHEHPHWKDHHQIQKVDKTFCDGFCKESDDVHELDENGVPKPLFCPCCNWEEDRLVISKLEKGEVIYV